MCAHMTGQVAPPKIRLILAVLLHACPMNSRTACQRASPVQQRGDAAMPDAAAATTAAVAAEQQQPPRPSAEAASLEQLSISGDDEGAAAFGSPVDVNALPLLAGDRDRA